MDFICITELKFYTSTSWLGPIQRPGPRPLVKCRALSTYIFKNAVLVSAGYQQGLHCTCHGVIIVILGTPGWPQQTQPVNLSNISDDILAWLFPNDSPQNSSTILHILRHKLCQHSLCSSSNITPTFRPQMTKKEEEEKKQNKTQEQKETRVRRTRTRKTKRKKFSNLFCDLSLLSFFPSA